MTKLQDILDRLRAEGKILELTDEQVAAIDKHIGNHMREFKAELRRKQAQSEADTARIILNA